MSTDGNKAIVRRLAEVWNQGKLELVDDLLVENYQHHDRLRAITTRAAYAQWVQESRAALPDLHLSMHDLVAEGDLVTVRWTLQGTHQGDFRGPDGMIPATGKRVTISGITLFQVQDGKLAEAWHMGDDLGFMQQIGLLPMAEQPRAAGPDQRQPADARGQGVMPAQDNKLWPRRFF